MDISKLNAAIKAGLSDPLLTATSHWFPGVDTAFVIDNPGNPQDLLCNYLFLCLDNSLPGHIVAKPIVSDGYVAYPILLLNSRYRFSEGTAAMHSLGLKEEFVKAIKQRNASQTKLDA